MTLKDVKCEYEKLSTCNVHIFRHDALFKVHYSGRTDYHNERIKLY